MLDFGASELFIIAVLAIIVVGPKELPKLIRSIMGMVRKVRAMGSEFQAGVKKMADEVELDAVTRKLNEAAKIDIEPKKPVDPAAEFSDYEEFDYDEFDYDSGSYSKPSKKEENAEAEPVDEAVATEEGEPAAEVTQGETQSAEVVASEAEDQPEEDKKVKSGEDE